LNLRRLIPLYIGAAMGPMGGFGIVTILPVMAQAWSVSFSTVAVSITVYMIPFIIIQIFSGSIAQLFDVRKTLIFGFTVYAVGALLSGLVAQSDRLSAVPRIVAGDRGRLLNARDHGADRRNRAPEQHVGKAIGLLGSPTPSGSPSVPFFPV
jgi:MFS family permease